MKLKTVFQDEDFELGEVCDVDIATMPDGRIKAQTKTKAGGLHIFFYDTLETFYNDWLDYKEPEKYWFVDEIGKVDDYLNDDGDYYENMKLIGNVFETKEEAEKAVEKLKAWKRLKDKGFRFGPWDSRLAGEDHLECCGHINIDASFEPYSDCRQDLDICFGGEE